MPEGEHAARSIVCRPYQEGVNRSSNSAHYLGTYARLTDTTVQCRCANHTSTPLKICGEEIKDAKGTGL